MSLRTITVYGRTEVQVYEVSFRRCRHGRILQSFARHAVSVPLLILYFCFLPPTIPSPFLLRIFLFRFPVLHLVILLFLASVFFPVCCDEAARWEVRGSNRSMGKGFSPFYESPDRFWCPPNPSLLFIGYLDSFSGVVVGGGGVNRLGREAKNSASFNMEVKFNWSCNSTPPIRLLVFRPLLFYLLRSFLS